MSSLIQALAFMCMVLGYVQGEQIQVKLPKPSRDPQGGCYLPDVINVGLLHPQTNSQWDLQLRRNDVISKNRMVYVMSQDENKRTVVEHVQIGGQEEVSQSYHNHEEGAAFLVTCTNLNTDHGVFLMEGSLYINGQKFRLTPASSWQQEADVASGDVTVIYDMQSITDFQPRDSAFIEAPDQRVRRTSERRRDQRVRRQASNYYIDILPVVDPQMYKLWEQRNSVDPETEISSYLAAVYTSVSMRMLTLTGSKKVYIRMLDPMIIKDPKQAPYGTVVTTSSGQVLLNATATLDSFKDWIKLMKNNLQEHDHAMLFTSYDLIGGIDSGINFNVTKGLAYVGKLCDPNGFSASVIGDKGAYQSEGVAAHELGHSLGAGHDGFGDSTSCRSEDRYIMSDSTYPQTTENIGNPWYFSPCSSRSIDNFLIDLASDNEILNQCLVKSLGVAVERNIAVRAEEQCRVFYGNDSFVCRGGESPPFSEICHEFFCYAPLTKTCVKMAPATGTCCGYQKKCLRGNCVAAKVGECPLDETCPLEDVKNYATSSGSGKCEDAPTGNCYNEAFRQQCCNACKKAKSTQTGCPYGDKLTGCKTTECGSKFSSGQFMNVIYDFVCCKTCDGVTQGCADMNSLTYENVPTTCKDLLLTQGRHEVCYKSLAHFNACCDTCELLRDKDNYACSWGDHMNCSSLWRSQNGSTCASLNGQMPNIDLPTECCATCPLIELRNSTDQGGTNQGGTNQGGTNQGGTNQGGTNQGGTDKPSTGDCEDQSRCGCDSLFSNVSWTVLISAVCVCLGQMWY